MKSNLTLKAFPSSSIESIFHHKNRLFRGLLSPVVFLIIGFWSNLCMGLDAPVEPLTTDEATLGLWHFNEGQGEVAFDSSANKCNARLTNFVKGARPPEWVDGKFGKAIKTDGEGSYVVMDDKALFECTNALTIEAWICFNSMGEENVEGSDKKHTLVPAIAKANSYWIRAASLKSMEFILYTDGPDDQNSSSITYGPMVEGRWYHVVAIYDGTKLYLIVDDKTITGTKKLTGNVKTSNCPVCIGTDLYRFGSVTVDELRISNSARYTHP